MNTTLNYKLNKPETDDFYDIEKFNQNADKIDTELKSLSDKIVPAKQKVIFITESGTLTLPENVKYINITVINGGSGGNGGNGTKRLSSAGAPGTVGAGGKIISFNNLKLEGALTFSIGGAGIGGAGGLGAGYEGSPEAGHPGTPGGITTVTINGAAYNSTTFSGYVNQTNPVFCPYTAEFYGKNGVAGGGNGVKYGDGGNGGLGGLADGHAGGAGGNGVGGCVIIHYIGAE